MGSSNSRDRDVMDEEDRQMQEQMRNLKRRQEEQARLRREMDEEYKLKEAEMKSGLASQNDRDRQRMESEHAQEMERLAREEEMVKQEEARISSEQRLAHERERQRQTELLEKRLENVEDADMDEAIEIVEGVRSGDPNDVLEITD